MTADQDVWNASNGIDPTTGLGLAWRVVHARSRTILSNLFKLAPFAWPNSASPSTTSEYDAITATAEQVSWRYIDAHGNVWDQKALNLVLIEWLLDGAPTPLTLAKIAQYRSNADQLRPWPTGFPGAFSGEPQQTYPAFPPAS
jgi:hypothetical protein